MEIAYLKKVHVVVTSSALRNIKNITPVWLDLYKLLF